MAGTQFYVVESGVLYLCEAFTSNDTWTVPTGVTSVDVLTVAGGGGGGKGSATANVAGGGGAGGCVYTAGFSVTPAASLTVTVGAGGAGATSGVRGTNGSNSVFDSITATGGGGGGPGSTTSANDTGSNGGSGGGGGGGSNTGGTSIAGGTGSQGNNGGLGYTTLTNSTNRAGAGGGGAGAAGGDAFANNPGAGGIGADYAAKFSTYYGHNGFFAGGGSGGGNNVARAGSTGGGGAGGFGATSAPGNGTANTGGGGGGGTFTFNGGTGGSGIVIVRYTMSGWGGVQAVAATGSATTAGSPSRVGKADFVDVVTPVASWGTSTVAAGFTATLPTEYREGDWLFALVAGKPTTASVTCTTSGWVEVGSGSGGTGANTADAGPMWFSLWAKEAVSSSETAPVFTETGSISVATWHTFAVRLGSNMTFADALLPAAPWVVSVADTNTATPLSGTLPALANNPKAGDLILSFGATPSDSNVVSGTSITATGLSGGTITTAASVTATGNDLANWRTTYTDFAGTASTALTVSYSTSAGTSVSGIIAVAHIRYTALGPGERSPQTPMIGTGAMNVPTIFSENFVPVPAMTATGVQSASVSVGPQIEYVGAGADASSSATATIDVPYPAGLQAGDVLVMGVGHDVNNVPTAPGGVWTNVLGVTDGNASGYRISYTVATGSETGSFAHPTSAVTTARGKMMAFRRVDTTTPLDVAVSTYSSTNSAAMTIPALTPSRSGVEFVYFSVNGTGGALTHAPPTTPFQFVETMDPGTGDPGFTSGYGGPWAGSGATTTFNLTKSISGRVIAMMMALRPATDSWDNMDGGLVTATGTGAMGVPTVTGGGGGAVNQTVNAVTATGSGSMVAPTVSAGSATTATVATGSGLMPTPTVTSTASVTAVAATGSGLMAAPAVTDEDYLPAVTATGSGLMPAPVVSGQANATVNSVVMTGSGQMGVPFVGATTSASVNAVVMTAAQTFTPTQTPIVVSPGSYVVANSAATLIDTTDTAVPAGHKIVAVFTWYNNVTLDSVSGGGLTWNIVGQTSGSTYHVGIATADAPAGLTSGTTITGTLSGVAYARTFRMVASDGLELDTNSPVDTYAFDAPETAVDWSVALTTSNADDLMFGFLFQDFYTGGVGTASPAVELYEWVSNGATLVTAYKDLSSAGAQTIGGTALTASAAVAAAVAFKASPTITPPIPTVIATSAVIAPAATGAAQGSSPALTAASEVTAASATGSGESNAPTVALSIVAEAIVATATGEFPAPIFGVPAEVLVPVMTGSGMMRNPLLIDPLAPPAPVRTLRVPPEDREFLIPAEARRYQVPRAVRQTDVD